MSIPETETNGVLKKDRFCIYDAGILLHGCRRKQAFFANAFLPTLAYHPADSFLFPWPQWTLYDL